MAIIGLGTDIVEISRISAIIGRSGDKLARRILHDNEWHQYQTHQQPARFLAKRFAAKEAAAKAFGSGIRHGLAFNQFEIIHNQQGKPELICQARAQQMAEQLGVTRIHISLADERDYACATVIMES